MTRKATELHGLKKPIRTGIRKMKAGAIKPPQVGTDPNDESILKREFVFVAQNGRAVKLPCTEHAFKRAEGRRYKTKAHTTLARRFNDHFFVAIDKATEEVVGVDIFPARLFTAKKDAPKFRQEQDQVLINVDQKTGEVEFLEVPPVEISSVPQVQNLLAAIDAVNLLYPGQILAGYEVMSTAGSRVALTSVGGGDDE